MAARSPKQTVKTPPGTVPGGSTARIERLAAAGIQLSANEIAELGMYCTLLDTYARVIETSSDNHAGKVVEP
jgi:hypothetical protein